MQLARVARGPDKAVVSLPDGEFGFTLDEFEMLSTGKPLPVTHPFSARLAKNPNIVVFSDGSAWNSSARRGELDKLTTGLSNAYPEVRVRRDPLTAETAIRAKTLGSTVLTKGRDLAAVIAADSFGVDDGSAIANVEDTLREAGAKVFTFPSRKMSTSSAPALLVVTGHESKELAKFVDELGKSGLMRNKVVIFNSCESELSRRLAAEITGKHGAVAVFVYEDELSAHAVEELLTDLATKLKSKGSKRPFELLFRDVVRSKNIRGMWVISMLFNPETDQCVV